MVEWFTTQYRSDRHSSQRISRHCKNTVDLYVIGDYQNRHPHSTSAIRSGYLPTANYIYYLFTVPQNPLTRILSRNNGGNSELNFGDMEAIAAELRCVVNSDKAGLQVSSTEYADMIRIL